MATTLPTFTPLEDSLWLTLCARALDNRRPHPMLGDATADQIVRTLDYDYRQFKITTNFILNVALRAKKLDEVTAGFLARHPTPSGSTWAPGSTPDSSAWPRHPASTGTTSTSPRSPPPARAWSPSTPTRMSSAPTCGTRTGWPPSPTTGRP